jgi:hypothetical protein
MPIGFGYQASNDAGYVNWAEVAQGYSTMLNLENKRREDKKAYYDEQDRQFAKDLSEKAPMGQYKDANDFISNYVENMTKQRLIDRKLFLSGKLKEKDYVLKTNNALDGTNTLFDLTKTYQDAFKDKMAGVNSGKLQAINTYFMSNIEGYADFGSSRAVIDPMSGKVNLAKLKLNPTTGIMELTSDVMPVGAAMRNIGTDIGTFDTDTATTNSIGKMGKLKTTILQAATTARAGSVTEFINSPTMFEKTFGPDGKKIIDDFNKGIENEIASYFSASPYNLSSVLTQNLKKYDATSFTFDRNEADNDPNKILLVMDPNSKMGVMDKTATNYAKQEAEAADFIRTQMLNKLDKEKNIQTSTGQLSPNYAPSYVYDREDRSKRTAQTGEMLAAIYGGNSQQASAARSYFKGLDNVSDVARDNTGVTVYYKDGSTKKIDFTAGGKEIGVDNFVAAGTKALLGNDANLSDARRGISKYRGAGLNTSYSAVKPSTTTDFSSFINKRIQENSSIINDNDNTSETITKLEGAYRDMGFDFSRPDNKDRGMVIITAKNGNNATINLYKDVNAAQNAIKAFISSPANQDKPTLRGVFAPGENPDASASEVVNYSTK